MIWAYAAGCFLWAIAIGVNMHGVLRNRRELKALALAKARLDDATAQAETARQQGVAQQQMFAQAFGLPAGAQITAIEVEPVDLPEPGKRLH